MPMTPSLDQHRTDAARFLENLRERLKKLGLEIDPDKTRRIECGRFAEENGINTRKKTRMPARRFS